MEESFPCCAVLKGDETNYHLMPLLLLRADAEKMEAMISFSATIIEHLIKVLYSG